MIFKKLKKLNKQDLQSITVTIGSLATTGIIKG